MAVGIRNRVAIEFGDRNRLNDGEPFRRAVLEIKLGILAVQSMKQFPGGIAQIKEWPAIVVDEETMISGYFQSGWCGAKSEGREYQ